MLLTVVTGLSLIGTPAPYQTWFGATAGAGPGGDDTSAPEVTRLTLIGTPGSPLLPEGYGEIAYKTASDTLEVSLTEAALGSSTKTWTFSGSAEGWADLDTDAYYVSFGYSGLDGNPAGALRASWLASGPNIGSEDARVSVAWTDLGVPPLMNVTHVELETLDAKVASANYITSQGLLVRLTNGSDGDLAANLFNEALPNTAGGWIEYTGRGMRAVDAIAQPSETVVYFRATYDASRSVLAGTVTTWVDNITVSAYWEPVAAATTAEAVTELKLTATPGGPIWDPSGREVSDFIAKTTTDTLAVAIFESPVDEQEVNTADSLRVSLTEAQASRLLSTVTDTVGVRFASESGIVVGSGGTPSAIPGADTVGVRLAEVAALAVAIDVTDDLTVSIDDATPTVDALTLEEKTASDTLTVSIDDQYVIDQYEGFVALNVADELFVRLTDAAALANTGVVSIIEIYPCNPTIEVWPANEQ